MSQKISILGTGNLGRAIALGLISTGDYNPSDITVTRRKISAIKDLGEKGIGITSDNIKAVNESEYVILGVQPQQLNDLLFELKDYFDKKKHVIISTVTGVSISEIEEIIGEGYSIVRATPNTAISIRQSMTSMSSKNTAREKVEQVRAIFDVMGKTIVIDEELMAAATVLGASGIAFCLRYIRAAAQGGIEMGFHPEEAQEIAVQTCKGAASLIIEGHAHPEMEIDKVTTPRGCTIAGLNEMEHNGLSSALIKGIVASHKKIANIK